MKDLEKIFRYTDSEMTKEEASQFVSVLAGNNSLNQTKCLIEEVDAVIADEQTFEFIERLKETQTLYNSIVALHYSVGDDMEIVTPQSKRIYWREIAAAIITFLLIISTIFFNFSKPTNKKIFSSYYEPYEVNNTHSRAIKSNSVNDLIDEAVAYYDNGNYKSAILLCKQIMQTDKKNVPAHFFTGVSYIELNDFNKAINHLSFVMGQNDVFFSKQAEWYLALCYFETNQIDLATSMLTSIYKSNKYYKEKASDLLKIIK